MILGQPMTRCLRQPYDRIAPVRNEKVKRTWARATAVELGYGGIAAVSQMTGLAPNTVSAGIRKVQHPEALTASTRIHRPGADRRSIVPHDPDPHPPPCWPWSPPPFGAIPNARYSWSSKSLRNLTSELRTQEYRVSDCTVSKLLKQGSYLGRPIGFVQTKAERKSNTLKK